MEEIDESASYLEVDEFALEEMRLWKMMDGGRGAVSTALCFTGET